MNILTKILTKLRLKKTSEWISIYEKMPPLQETVVLYTKYGCLCGSRYMDRKPRKTAWIDDMGGQEINNESVPDDEMVTHWMPLPDAPKQQT